MKDGYPMDEMRIGIDETPINIESFSMKEFFPRQFTTEEDSIGPVTTMSMTADVEHTRML